MLRMLAITVFLAGSVGPISALAQEAGQAEPPMTIQRMNEIVQALDPDAQVQGTSFTLTVGETPVLIITDLNADRMRAMVRVAAADEVDEDQLRRMMQANFDSALDARYAVARGQVWSIFIHPFSPLERDQFISGIGQAVNAANTFGTLYTGGALQFGGGDSPGLQRQLLDELLKKGEEI